MSENLVIGGGGSTAVATDDLFEQAQSLEWLRDELTDCRRRLVSWPLTEEVDGRVTNHVAWSSGALEEAAIDCGQLAAGLRRAAERYGALERSLTRVRHDLGAEAAYIGGMLLPGLVALHGPAIVLGLLTGMAVSVAAGGPDRAVAAAGEWLRANPRMTNNPLIAGLVRTAVSSVDDYGMGVLHVPPTARALLGEDGFGVLGVPETGAVLVAGATAAGFLRETPVRVRRVDPEKPAFPSAPLPVAPRGFGDLAARVPPSSAGDAQVRIEKYTGAGGHPRYLVFVGGTIDPSPRARTEPWDVTSGVRAVVGQDAGAVRAVERAMTEAGIDAHDPVLLTGYSLGGVAAHEVAERGAFAVEGVVTLGAPIGQRETPDGIPVVAVEHTEDVLAALGGQPSPPGGAATDPLVVRRSVMDADGPRSDTIFAAHGLADYRHTAGLMDASEEARLLSARRELERFLDGATTGSVSHWRADRVGSEISPAIER